MNIDFKLQEFEGPLDLLLHLIKENKMNIFDIPIEEITNQYLAYIKKMEEMNLDIASSYLVMASDLIELKSKLLLPRKVEEEAIEEEDPREKLVSRLLEYQQYKEITKTLKEKEELRKEIYTKSSSNLKEYMDQTVTIQKEVTLDDLMDAFQKFLRRQKEKQPLHTQVTTRGISVEERSRDIRHILKRQKRISFFELFDIINREYIVVTFLAVLEMAKQGELCLVQENNFDEITCEVAQ